MNILIVCHANRCRSPFTAALLRQYLPTDYEIASAGVGIVAGGLFGSGSKATRPTRDIARALDLDLEGHRSQAVSPALIEWSEMIVYMDRSNKTRLERMATTKCKVVSLASYATPPQNRIPDPGYVNRFNPEFMEIMALIVRATHGLATYLAHQQGKSVSLTLADTRNNSFVPQLDEFNAYLRETV